MWPKIKKYLVLGLIKQLIISKGPECLHCVGASVPPRQIMFVNHTICHFFWKVSLNSCILGGQEKKKCTAV